jgi:hypothetical protein
MIGRIEAQPKPLAENIDSLVFIKNGYSLFAHLVPVGIASLLLLLLSVPEDNLLLKLVNTLHTPGPIWIPAVFVTLISALIYYSTIQAKIRQAYLWPEGDLRRTLGTFMFYTILVSLLVYLVLFSIQPKPPAFSDLWACLLVAFLSLTGLGWQGPSALTDAIGIKLPDYTDSRAAAQDIAEFLCAERKKRRSDIAGVNRFVELLTSLRSSIEKNLVSEPAWARPELQAVSGTLQRMIDHVKDNFTGNDPSMIEGFAAACQCSSRMPYLEFVEILTDLAKEWPAWGCNSQKGV